jgi:protein-L-isoaspartate(D-aspartate) O-methyltransferase
MVMDEEEKLIQGIKCFGYLKSIRVENALRKYRREFFVPDELKHLAYRDSPISIGFNQTISQPSTVVVMTEALNIKEGDKVLEIGTGSGWQSSILSYLVGEKGHVYSIEILEDLAEFARANFEKVGVKNVEVIVKDGSLGLQEKAPFDRIIVTAACPDVPKPLFEQLRIGGEMVLPIGNLYLQEMFLIRKLRDGRSIRKSLGNYMFVPLIGEHGFK